MGGRIQTELNLTTCSSCGLDPMSPGIGLLACTSASSGVHQLRSPGRQARAPQWPTEELESHVLFSGAFIDFEGAFKLTTVVTAYAKAYEGEDWRLELKHFNDKNNGFSTDHLPSQVGLTANDGCVKMVDCGHHNEKMFCGRGPKQFGWKNYEREAGTNQIVGMAIHETWMRPGKTDGQWTVQDLCEIVLCRYRVKRPNKLGS